MPNANYIKGVRKERKIVNEAREEGLVSFRSAGSHSPIDVVIINSKIKLIKLIQCKPYSMSGAAKLRLMEQLGKLNGVYQVWTEVR